VGVVLYVALATAACALLSLLLYRLAFDGTGAFGDSSWAILPAGLFLAVNAAGAVLGIRSLGQQIASSRRLGRRVARLASPPSPDLAEQARSAGIRGRLEVIDSAGPFSFAYGAFRPRVVVSQGLVDAAVPEELRAVLAHERYHVRNLDPLKVVLARAMADTFFLVPALRVLQERYLAGRELAADRRALRACGRHPLASALLKVVRGPDWPELSTAAAIGGPELLDARVAQLESGSQPSDAPLPRRTVLLSGLTLALLGATFVAAVLGLGGLAAGMGMSHHSADAAGAGAAMAVACASPAIVAGWLGWRWYRA
jgi:Zn-dependent protease with chaperone function